MKNGNLLHNLRLALELILIGGMAALMIAVIAVSSARASVSDDLNGLDSNQDVRDRVAHLDSRSRIGIVENRTVNLNNRLEFGVNYGPVMNGDSYVNTQNLGGQIDYHFSPKFSLGVRYEKSFNSLSSAGQQAYDQASQLQQTSGAGYAVPQIDYPDQTVLGIFNWYMLYGKINFFDISVVQFDIYTLGGYGQVQGATSSGTTWTSGTWTAGAGMAFWISQHVSTRLELRYQAYADQNYTGSRDENIVVGSLGLGVLL